MKRSDAVIVLAALAAHALHVALAWARVGELGFPLDDAWIHQAFARSLAEDGTWGLVPGAPSAGVSSLAFPVLLAGARALGMPGPLAALALGALSLAALGVISARALPRAGELERTVVGVCAVTTSALAWASASGMETSAAAAIVLALWVWAWRREETLDRRPLALRDALAFGALALAAVLVRPDLALAPAALALALAGTRGPVGARAVRVALALALALAAGAAFVVLHLALTGRALPATLAAKAAEYAPLLERALALRIVEQLAAALGGSQAIFAIPALWLFARVGRARRVEPVTIGCALWIAAHLALYAARLPVTYHHARYAAPIVPVLIALGARGAHAWREASVPAQRTSIVTSRVLPASALALSLAGLAIGAAQYAREVAYVDREMVAPARWLAAHAASSDVVAAHDVGALGYFAPRPIVDLGGLVTPEAVPIVHDADRLLALARARDARWVVFFPAWSAAYRELSSRAGLEPAWRADEAPDERDDTGPMTIYRLAR